jgi:ethanolamine utilization protein EutP
MRKKRVMIIGPTRCGKTSLANAINGSDRPIRRTQDIIYGERTIDVPGSYIENTDLYKHIIAAAQDAVCVLILTDQSAIADVYSPGFARVFTKPTFGVVTKTDLARDNADSAVRRLAMSGAGRPYFRISTADGTGVEELKRFLFEKFKELKGG